MIEIKNNNNTKTRLAIDILIFVAFLIAMDPRSSGIAVHEWLSTAALAAIVVHLLISWDWIVQVSRRFVEKLNGQTRFNYILNWAMFFDVALLMFSGFMISESVLPVLGISLAQNFVWRPLHDMSANLFMILLGLHTALHWNWIVATLKKYVFKPVGDLLRRKEVVT